VVNGPPNYIVIVYDWYRDRAVGTFPLRTEVSRITISPKDNHMICTTGPSHWKVWRVEESTFKTFGMFSPLPQNESFTDHDWFDEDTIVTVSSLGQVFIAKSAEPVKRIEFAFGSTADQVLSAGSSAATTVACFSRGFVIGSDEGVLAFWEKNDNKEQEDQEDFEFARSWSTGRKFPIGSLAISANEETLGISLKNNDIGTCSLSHVYLSTGLDSRDVKVNLLCSGFHNGTITGMDVALQRPLLVTCSADATLKIWNYVTLKCELAKKMYLVDKDTVDPAGEAMTSPLLSVAFHPTGYYLAVGFVDKIRICHVLQDELRVYREISIKQATVLKFSRGGSMLAAASSKVVYVYSAYTLQQLIALKFHAAPVQDISWSIRDLHLVTVGSDGGIYEFDTENFNKLKDFQERSSDFVSVTYMKDDTILVCGVNAFHSVIRESFNDDFREHSLGVRNKLRKICYFETFHGCPAILSGDIQGSLQIYGSEASGEFHEELVAQC
jgi:WD40 repeat protein